MPIENPHFIIPPGSILLKILSKKIVTDKSNLSHPARQKVTQIREINLEKPVKQK